jgi:hypothetical protein
VLDELRTGRVWREIDEGLANEVTVIEWIIEGQFNRCRLQQCRGLVEGRERGRSAKVAQHE